MCPQDTNASNFPPLYLPHILSKLCNKQSSWTDRWTEVPMFQVYELFLLFISFDSLRANYYLQNEDLCLPRPKIFVDDEQTDKHIS